MNDLMTKSFLSFVELKKQSRMELESEPENDIEKGQLSPMEEANLSKFFQEVDAIKSEMEEITNLLLDLHNLNEETKSTHSAKVLRGQRDRMDSDMVSALGKAKLVKTRLEVLDKSNAGFREGSMVDRTRSSITSGLRIKLRDTMNDFQTLRDKILSDHREYLRRRFYNATGKFPSEEVVENMVSGNGKIEVFEGRKGVDLAENAERHGAVMDIQRSLNNLHQVFLDMEVLVKTQGGKVDDIESNMVNARSFVSGGTNSLFYAKQMKKKGRKGVFWAWVVGLIILLVCFIGMLSS